MIAWSALLLPSLVAAVLVFFASSVIHMVLKLHASGMKSFSNEDEVRGAINHGSPSPGLYVLPHCKDPKEAAEPAMVAKYEEGPVGLLYLRKSGAFALGPFLGQWFAYTLVIGLVTGYVAHAALPLGAPPKLVFQVVGATAWLAYAFQGPSDSIWMGKPWRRTAGDLFDGLVYAVLTAAAYAWLWPAS